MRQFRTSGSVGALGAQAPGATRVPGALACPRTQPCYSAGAQLTVTDAAGLVMIVNYSFGMSASGELAEASGVTVSPGPGICVGGCSHLKRQIVFSGTSTVSLAPGASGSFKLGALGFTALALAWSERQATSSCADAYPYFAWAIWRQAP